MISEEALTVLTRIADALERLAPAEPPAIDFMKADAFVWDAARASLRPIEKIAAVPRELLCGIDRVADILLDNTLRFAKGLPANNALLWGARGMGKSSLVKAVHAAANEQAPGSCVLVEIHREDIESLPILLGRLADAKRRFILFCDDLSFDAGESSYKSLKAVLEGGLEGRPEHVVFYATSNRRHLMPREMMENERRTGIHPGEAVEEKVSLSDRFGLWLGFHSCDQETYLAAVRGYCNHLGIAVDPDELRRDALEWATTRGSRSGRVAWQFIQDLAGRRGMRIAL